MVSFQYPFPVKFLDLGDQIRIAYVDEGQGDQVLLMIHGLGSYLPAWQKNITDLKQDYRCIALDLPNYGKSGKGAFPFTMRFFAKILAGFIESLDLKNLTLIGHSMGAQIALTTLLETEVSIDQLVLIAPAGFETFSDADKAFFYKNITPESIRDLSVDQIKVNFDLNFHNGRLPEDAQFMFEDRLAMLADREEFEWYYKMVPLCVKAMLEAPVFDLLKDIELPTLILFGKEDLLIPNQLLHPELTTHQVAMSGHEQIVNSHLAMLSPCGHFVQWDRPEEVNTLIRSFLEDKALSK